MSVKKVANDTYAVTQFLKSMPDVSCIVRFEKNEARIVERTGYTGDQKWDQLAIQTVQSSLIQNLLD